LDNPLDVLIGAIAVVGTAAQIITTDNVSVKFLGAAVGFMWLGFIDLAATVVATGSKGLHHWKRKLEWKVALTACVFMLLLSIVVTALPAETGLSTFETAKSLISVGLIVALGIFIVFNFAGYFTASDPKGEKKRRRLYLGAYAANLLIFILAWFIYPFATPPPTQPAVQTPAPSALSNIVPVPPSETLIQTTQSPTAPGTATTSAGPQVPSLTELPSDTAQPASTTQAGNINTLSSVLGVRPGPIYSLAFSPDGALLAAGAADNTVQLWHLAQNEQPLVLAGHSEPVSSIAFSRDGKLISSGSWDGTVRLERVGDGSLVGVLTEPHRTQISSIALSPDTETLAIGLYARDDQVELWHIDYGAENLENNTLTLPQLLHTLAGHTNSVYGVAFSPDATMLASASEDTTVRLWQVNGGTAIRTLTEEAPVQTVAFSPDGMLLASGLSNYTVTLRRVSDGMLLYALRGHEGIVHSVAFSPDGQVLVSGAHDGRVRLWKVADGAYIRALESGSPVFSVALSPDGRVLAVGLENGAVQLWRAP
jgi:WD40 repeat protein